MSFIDVNKNTFYAYLALPGYDIVIGYCGEKETTFNHRSNPQRIIGKTEGYKTDEKFYRLSESALAELKKVGAK